MIPVYNTYTHVYINMVHSPLLDLKSNFIRRVVMVLSFSNNSSLWLQWHNAWNHAKTMSDGLVLVFQKVLTGTCTQKHPRSGDAFIKKISTVILFCFHVVLSCCSPSTSMYPSECGPFWDTFLLMSVVKRDYLYDYNLSNPIHIILY